MSDDDEDLNVNLENGHYSSGQRTPESDSDGLDAQEVEEEPPTGNASNFDTNLPTTHKYLGKLENISGYTIYDDGQVIDMLAMYTNTLVFPGFTLPLVIRDDLEVENIYQDFKNGYTFVLTCLNPEGNDFFEYGVVMEVFENSVKRGSVTMKAKGRQRCRISEHTMPPTWGRMSRVKVQILPDVLLPTPLADTQLLTLKQRRRSNLDYEDYNKFFRNRRFHLAQFPFPSWVYDRYEINFYMKHMLVGLAQYYVKACIPRDPTALSYWFVQNFQLTHSERLRILATNTTLERLRVELKYLTLERLICCGRCGVDIANQNKVFAMSKDGVQSNYVNPGGVVYETVTVTEARNFQLDGLPSRQFSWFPGYAWTIMKCNLCKGHLGWEFTSKQLQPSRFYGLAHSCLKIKILTNGSQSDEDHSC